MFSETERTPEEPLSREERQQHARATTRRAILDAALSLFVSDGYAQVSIRNIAAKVEYSPGAIYSYFTSKDEIFFALAEEGFRLLGLRRSFDMRRAMTRSTTFEPRPGASTSSARCSRSISRSSSSIAECLASAVSTSGSHSCPI